MREGDWILDKDTGRLGNVIKVFSYGVTARFDGMTATRKYEEIELAPLDMQAEDVKEMLDLALQTKDEEWFRELTSKC
jgi:hypothetical protein